MAADCKSAGLRPTEVRTLPPPIWLFPFRINHLEKLGECGANAARWSCRELLPTLARRDHPIEVARGVCGADGHEVDI